MRDDDRLLDLPEPEFGSGVVGVCDICGTRQAVIVLLKERYKLCVLDFLNKTWIKSEKTPSVPAPLYRSERVWYPTTAVPSGKAPAVVLTPTKPVRHPVVLVTPDVYGITTTMLDAAIRLAREGFEVLLPDIAKTEGVGVGHHVALRSGRAFRGGIPVGSPKVGGLLAMYRDALRYLLGREMIDPTKTAVFGASYGGALAIALAAESTSLSAVAVAYPVSVTPANLPGLVTSPLLLVRGSADRVAERAEQQVRANASADGQTFLVVPGARHGFLSRDLGAYRVELAEPAWTAIVAFLKQRLMPPPPRPPPPPTKPAATPGASPVPPAAAVGPGRENVPAATPVPKPSA